MRLIDADKLIRRMRIDMDRMKYQYNLDVIEGMSLAIGYIVGSPTSFDVEKVLNELKHEESEALRRYSESKGTAYAFSDKCSCDNWAKAIEIVKRGGREC